MKNMGMYLAAIMAMAGSREDFYQEFPDSDFVINEYELIKLKKSRLNRKDRDAIVHYRENNLAHIGR